MVVGAALATADFKLQKKNPAERFNTYAKGMSFSYSVIESV
jgi:hypothetical protein